MSKLDVVVVSGETPIILFSGNHNPLIKILINQFHEEFKIAYVSDNPAAPHKDENFYRIETGSAYLVKNLEEKIDYAVIFIEDERDRKYISHLFEKLATDETRVAVIIPVELASTFTDILSEYKKNPNFYFLIEGDVYSENNPVFASSQTGRLIKKTLTTKSFNLEDRQDAPLYPIYLDDAIVGINQILFGKDKRHKFYFLFYEQPQNYISAIHIIKRIEPDLVVNFDEDKSKEGQITREALEQVLSSQVPAAPLYLDKYLQGFEKSLSYFSNPEEAEIPEESERKVKPLPNKRQIKFSFKAFLLGAVFYVFLSFLALGLGLLSFKFAVDDFRSGRYESASQNSKNAKVFIDASSPNIRLVALAAASVGINGLSEQYSNLANATTMLDIASHDFDNIKNLLKGLDRETLDVLIADASYIYFKTN